MSNVVIYSLDILEIDPTIGDEFDEEFKTEPELKLEPVLKEQPEPVIKTESEIKKEPVEKVTLLILSIPFL